ncbi:hypothetical protein BJF85_03545 [Saccharomonospora sp. CUA-673]|nr:hypothetical protein BJF85_03545 [Saccharomonospora sp. CUA-673]
MLELWAAVPLLCAGSAALLLTRFTRTAAVACWIPAIPVGTVSVLLTVQAFDRDGPVGIAAPGPVVTATGTAVAAVAAVGVLASAHLRKGAR